MIQALRKDKGHFRYCKRAVQAWIEAGSSVRLGREGGREGRKREGGEEKRNGEGIRNGGTIWKGREGEERRGGREGREEGKGGRIPRG